MSSSHRTSKGKARSSDADYEPSLASLSLNEYDPRAYADTYDSAYDSTYTGGDQNYSFAAQSTRALPQSSSTTYRSAGVYGSYPPTSSTGGYEYQSQNPSTSNYSGYDGFDSASVASSSVPSYGGGGSGSVWSDTQSQGTMASSAPSRAPSHHTDVNNTIHRQAAPNQVYELPCELSNLTGCNVVFPGDDEDGWMAHIERHLGGRFPSKLRCCKQHRSAG